MDDVLKSTLNHLKSREKLAGTLMIIPYIILIASLVFLVLWFVRRTGSLWLPLATLCVGLFYWFFFTYLKGYYKNRISSMTATN